MITDKSIDMRALMIALVSVVILCALVWMVSQLSVASRMDSMNHRLQRVEVVQDAHMEGHPQTVRDELHQHVQDHDLHMHGLDVMHPTIATPPPVIQNED